MSQPRAKWKAVVGRIGLIYGLHEVRKNQRRSHFVSTVIPKNGVGAELGVHKGLFTPTLLKYAQPQKLYLVDPWYLLSETWEWTGGNKSTVDALRAILNRFRRELVTGKVVVEISDDMVFLERCPDQFFDWVYIDTSHEYEHTKRELAILDKKVKPNGVIAGDDWQSDPQHRHHGVMVAVQEFLASNPYELIYSNDHDKQWAIRRTGQASA